MEIMNILWKMFSRFCLVFVDKQTREEFAVALDLISFSHTHSFSLLFGVFQKVRSCKFRFWTLLSHIQTFVQFCPYKKVGNRPKKYKHYFMDGPSHTSINEI